MHCCTRGAAACRSSALPIRPAPFGRHPSEPPAPVAPEQTSLRRTTRLTYAVDIAFCINVTGSMTPIIDQVKNNVLRFYDDNVRQPTRSVLLYPVIARNVWLTLNGGVDIGVISEVLEAFMEESGNG